MKLTSKQAREMLEQARKNAKEEKWIDHSICVGQAVGRIAEALNKKGHNLDVDKAITLGLVHDIGKIKTSFSEHDMEGYNYMKEQGYDEDYCNICLIHPYLNNDVNCTAGGFPSDIPFRTEFVKNHEYTIYEKMVNLCDLMCTKVVMTVDKRLIDIMIRRGAYSNTQYHVKETYKLKEYFDNLLGYSVYDLFPEIKENL